MNPCCATCICSAVPAELVDPLNPKPDRLECRRHPTPLRKKATDWCGEFQWKVAVPPNPPQPAKEQRVPMLHNTALGLGSDFDWFS